MIILCGVCLNVLYCCCSSNVRIDDVQVYSDSATAIRPESKGHGKVPLEGYPVQSEPQSSALRTNMLAYLLVALGGVDR